MSAQDYYQHQAPPQGYQQGYGPQYPQQVRTQPALCHSIFPQRLYFFNTNNNHALGLWFFSTRRPGILPTTSANAVPTTTATATERRRRLHERMSGSTLLLLRSGGVCGLCRLFLLDDAVSRLRCSTSGAAGTVRPWHNVNHNNGSAVAVAIAVHV